MFFGLKSLQKKVRFFIIVVGIVLVEERIFNGK